MLFNPVIQSSESVVNLSPVVKSSSFNKSAYIEPLEPPDYELSVYPGMVTKREKKPVPFFGVGASSVSKALTFSNDCPEWLQEFTSKEFGASRIASKVKASLRGRVTSFSESSRVRLLKFMAMTDCRFNYMLTLTYPGDYKDFAFMEVMKGHLKNFKARLDVSFPDIRGVWRLEPQKRGAPHFHLLLEMPPVPDLVGFYGWVASTWFEIVGSEDDKHLRAGTRVDALDNKKKIRSYVSKYVAKVSQLQVNWGRWWGVIGRMESVAPVKVTLNYSQAMLFRRIARRMIKAIPKGRGLHYSNRLRTLTEYFLLLDSEMTFKIIDYVKTSLPDSSLKPPS